MTKKIPNEICLGIFHITFGHLTPNPTNSRILANREDYATSEFSMPLRSFARFDLFALALDFTNSGASTSLRHTAQLGVMMSVLGALCCLGNQWCGGVRKANNTGNWSGLMMLMVGLMRKLFIYVYVYLFFSKRETWLQRFLFWFLSPPGRWSVLTNIFQMLKQTTTYNKWWKLSYLFLVSMRKVDNTVYKNKFGILFSFLGRCGKKQTSWKNIQQKQQLDEKSSRNESLWIRRADFRREIAMVFLEPFVIFSWSFGGFCIHEWPLFLVGVVRSGY